MMIKNCPNLGFQQVKKRQNCWKIQTKMAKNCYVKHNLKPCSNAKNRVKIQKI